MSVFRALSLVSCLAALPGLFAADAAPASETPPVASGSATTPELVQPAEVETPDDPTFRFERQMPAAPASAKRWSAGVALSGGYDSNILRENTDLPVSTDAKGFAWSVEGQAQVRLVDGDAGRITAGGTAGNDVYPTEHDADLLRFGGFISAVLTPDWHQLEPGAVIGHHRFLLDGRRSATATTGNLFVTRVMDRHVSVLGGSIQHLTYEATPDASGNLLDLSYRHWYLFQRDAVSRRIEAGLRLGSYRADGESSSYRMLTPSAALFYRLTGTAQPDAGTIDLLARGSVDFRRYDATATGDLHRLHLIAAYAQADYWWNRWLSTGLFAGISSRASTATSEDYQRHQAGLRLAATW